MVVFVRRSCRAWLGSRTGKVGVSPRFEGIPYRILVLSVRGGVGVTSTSIAV